MAVEEFLGGGIIIDFFISQQGDQAFLQSSKTAFDFAFGPVVGGGSVAKEAQAVGIDGQRQLVLAEESPEMLKMVPRRVGGDKAGLK